MEVRDYARELLNATTLQGKLAPPPGDLTDEAPGPALRVEAPARPPELAIRPGPEAKVPPIEGVADPAQRVRILHAFANHELQAAELFAFALLAFPDAPRPFRRGLLRILGEEQVHCRLYLDRLAALGARFGDHPVSGYFWSKVGDLTTPLRFVAAMSLTFESANLDHAVEYAHAARRAGDGATANALERVHADELGHVQFGWIWLGKLKDPDATPEAAYLANLVWPLRPARARGRVFHPESRAAAGLPPSFVRLLAGEEE